MVTLPFDQGMVTGMLSLPEGNPIFPVYLEPELLSGVRGESRQVREWIPFAQIPPRIIETVLTIEDRRFYSHFGIDPVAVGRAVWTNFTQGRGGAGRQHHHAATREESVLFAAADDGTKIQRSSGGGGARSEVYETGNSRKLSE